MFFGSELGFFRLSAICARWTEGRRFSFPPVFSSFAGFLLIFSQFSHGFLLVFDCEKTQENEKKTRRKPGAAGHLAELLAGQGPRIAPRL